MSGLGTGLPGSRPITVTGASRGSAEVSSKRTKRSALVVTMTTSVAPPRSAAICPGTP